MKSLGTKIGAVLSCALVSVGSLVAGQSAKTPVVGDMAPPISGKDQDGKVWKLTDALKKHAVLLYFYPKDNTPGCTKEACGFRDRIGELQKQGVQVIGVSFDSAESHRKFIAKYGLNFSLLVDSDGKIADAYGTRMAGRNMDRRISFLIARDGKIEHVTDNMSAEAHLSEMKEAIAKLEKKKHS